jgi:hypothetical protein
MKDALVRLKAVFHDTPGGELNLIEAARLAGLDDKVCQTLLWVLCDTGVLEPRRSGVFVAVRP